MPFVRADSDQRYYASNFARFMSPDRYKASGRAKDPGSWNRYAYTIGDPVNRFDPSGRFYCDPDDPDCDPCAPPSEDVDDPGDPGDPGDPCPGDGGGGGGDGYDTACAITVADSGTPIHGQNLVNLTTYSPLKNKLGPYNTIGRLGAPQGWFDAVQIQAQLFGDTDPQDWIASQTKSSYGSVTLAGRPTPITGSTQTTPDNPEIGINSSTTGYFDWLDEPGAPTTQFGQQVIAMNLTQVFTSTLTNILNGATCSVTWSVTIKAKKVGNKWNETTTFQLLAGGTSGQ